MHSPDGPSQSDQQIFQQPWLGFRKTKSWDGAPSKSSIRLGFTTILEDNRLIYYKVGIEFANLFKGFNIFNSF